MYKFLEMERAALAHAAVLTSEMQGRSYKTVKPDPQEDVSEDDESSSKGESLKRATTLETDDRSKPTYPPM